MLWGKWGCGGNLLDRANIELAGDMAFDREAVFIEAADFLAVDNDRDDAVFFVGDDGGTRRSWVPLIALVRCVLSVCCSRN
jgi:hypothetical protein